MEVEEVGPLPTLPPPDPGASIYLHLDGAPPEKTFGRSMRNAGSSQRQRFLALRAAAIEAMAGRKWHEGPVDLHLIYRSPDPPGVFERYYLDGIMDTLGGCHGPTFIYLPVVYLDDCQIVTAAAQVEVADEASYDVYITFR